MADNVEIQGLEFQLQATTENGSKGVNALAESFKKLKQALKGNAGLSKSTEQLSKLSDSLKSMTGSMDKLEKMATALNGLGQVKISSSIPNNISRIGDALKTITDADLDRMDRLADAMSRAGAAGNIQMPNMTGGTGGNPTGGAPNDNAADSTTEAVNETTRTVQGATRTWGEMFQTVGQQYMTGVVQPIINSVSSIGSPLNAVKGMFSGLNGFLQNITQGLLTLPLKIPAVFMTATSAIQRMVGALRQLGGNLISKIKNGFISLGKSILNTFAHPLATMSKFKSGLAGIAKKITGVGSSASSSGSKLGQFFNSIKRIAMYRMIRSAMSALVQSMKDGIGNLYQYSLIMGGQFSNSMNSLATNALYLKNSLGAMAAPIINALAPAIDFVTDKLVFLFNLINQVFSKLTGKSTYTVAKRVSTQYAAAADNAASSAADSAKDAAEKIKRYTLGFDELNILGDNSDSNSGSGGTGGSGGGAGTPDYGSMFTEVPIDNNVSDFMDRLKEAFNNGDWKEVGTMLGQKVNEIVDSIDWDGIGHKLGYGMNAAIQILYYFLETVDFRNIGNHFSELLNAAFSEIDFTILGRLIGRWFTIIPELIIGVVEKLDWTQVGTKLSDGIKGMLQEWIDWGDLMDWQNLGQMFGNKFNEAVDAIDYTGIGSRLGTVIDRAVKILYNFIKTLDLMQVGTNLASLISSAISNVDWSFVGRLITQVFLAIPNLIIGAVRGLDWGAVGKGVGDCIKGIFDEAQEWIASIDWAEMAHELWKDFKDAVTGLDLSGIADSFFKLLGSALGAAVSFIATLVGDIWADITGYFSDFLTNDDGTKKCGLDWVAGLLEGIWEGVKNIATWIYDHVFKPFIDGFKDAFGIHSPSTVMAEQGGFIVSGLLNGITEAWHNIVDFFGEKLAAIGEKISEAWGNIKEAAGTAWENIKTTIGTKWENLKQGASETWEKLKTTIGTGWENIKSGASTAWENIKTTVGGAWSNLKSNASTTWSNLKTTIGNGWNNIKSTTSTVWGNVKTSVGNTWSNLKSTASTTWGNLKSTISTGWNNVKSNTSTVWNNVKSSLGTAWGNIKSSASTTWGNLKSTISQKWNDVKSNTSTVWNNVKSSLSSTWNNIKSNASTTWSNLKSTVSQKWSDIKSNTSTVWGNINSTLSGKFSTLKSNFSTTFENLKSTASSKFENIKSTVSNAVDRLKGFLNFHWSLPSLKLPHFSISGNFSLNPPSIPHFSVSWYKTGAILDGAQLFGAANGKMLGGGEAGKEAVLPLETHTEWMDDLARRVRDGLPGADSSEQLADSVREGVFEANARQNELLKEQNELLRQLLAKDTNVEVTTSSFTKAMNKKNRRDGKTVIPVGT